MTEKEARNAYMRAWRAKNPDKVRQNNENYWKRKVQKMMEKEAANNDRNANCTTSG